MKPKEAECLTEEEREMADVLLEATRLEEHSEVELSFFGQEGTLHYGFGRCFRHLLAANPELMESTEAIEGVRAMAVASLVQVGAMPVGSV